MRAALVLAAYAAVAAWFLPALLARLTTRGISPRLGLGAWLAAMLSPLVAIGLAFYFFSRTPQADFPGLTRLLCREVAGGACTPQVYQSELYQAGAAVVMILAGFALLTAAWRWARKVERSRRQTRAHGRAARLVGRPLFAGDPFAGDPFAGHPAVVLEDPRPAAYCAAGTIVVTRGALNVLDDAQLAAVLAHEKGHLRGHHHVLALMTRGLTAAFPGVPLFAAGEREVSRLAEMSADDAVIRAKYRAGIRATLVSALIAIATGEAVPANQGPPDRRPADSAPGGPLVPRDALAAATHAVQARVERLLRPPTRASAVAHAAALTMITLALAAFPALLALA